MADNSEVDKGVIHDSPPSGPMDDFWLEQGRKLVEGSASALCEAAKSVLTALGLLNTIYLGILGFAEYIPKTLAPEIKALFTLPVLVWMLSLYCGLSVMMTKKANLNLSAPDQIREESGRILRRKQESLMWAFWLLTLGLVVAVVLVIFSPELQ